MACSITKVWPLLLQAAPRGAGEPRGLVRGGGAAARSTLRRCGVSGASSAGWGAPAGRPCQGRPGGGGLWGRGQRGGRGREAARRGGRGIGAGRGRHERRRPLGAGEPGGERGGGGRPCAPAAVPAAGARAAAAAAGCAPGGCLSSVRALGVRPRAAQCVTAHPCFAHPCVRECIGQSRVPACVRSVSVGARDVESVRRLPPRRAAGLPARAEAGAAGGAAGAGRAPEPAPGARGLPRSWLWWAMRAVVQQQRLLAGPAAALRGELQALVPQVLGACSEPTHANVLWGSARCRTACRHSQRALFSKA